jgi:hypothetical protein
VAVAVAIVVDSPSATAKSPVALYVAVDVASVPVGVVASAVADVVAAGCSRS